MRNLGLLAYGMAFLTAGWAAEPSVLGRWGFEQYPTFAQIAPAPDQENLWNANVLGEGKPVFHNAAVIRSNSGGVEVSADGKTWKKARNGYLLGKGAAVRTSQKKGIIEICLKENGPMLRAQPNTALRIEEIDVNAAGLFIPPENSGAQRIVSTKLELHTGRVMALVSKLGEGSQYMIRTGSTITRCRGGQFVLSADGSLIVVEGDVEIIQHGQRETVPPGHEWKPTRGARLFETQKLDLLKPVFASMASVVFTNSFGRIFTKVEENPPYRERYLNKAPPDSPENRNANYTPPQYRSFDIIPPRKLE